MKVIIIGGGPAGMLAAIHASQSKDQVTILEKMSSVGKKLLITGKGRCNITSSLPMEEFISNVPGNGMFLHSCFNSFTNQDIITLLEKEGLKLKEERGHRIFPVTDQAKDVLNAFLKILKRQNVEIKTNVKVNEIITQKGRAEECNTFLMVKKKKFLQTKLF